MDVFRTAFLDFCPEVKSEIYKHLTEGRLSETETLKVSKTYLALIAQQTTIIFPTKKNFTFTPLRLKKTISYIELPDAIKSALLYNNHTQTTLWESLIFRMFSLCHDINCCARSSNLKDIQDLTKTIPLFNIFFGLCENNNNQQSLADINSLLSEFPIRAELSTDEIKLFLVSLCDTFQSKLNPIKENINENGIKSIELLLGIIDEIRKTLSGEKGLKINDYEISLRNITDTLPIEKNFSSVCEIILTSKKCFKLYNELFLSVLSPELINTPNFKIAADSTKIFTTCIKNIKQRAKKTNSEDSSPDPFLDLSQYLFEKGEPIYSPLLHQLCSNYFGNHILLTNVSYINSDIINTGIFDTNHPRSILPITVKSGLLDIYAFKQIHAVLMTAINSILFTTFELVTQKYSRIYKLDLSSSMHNIKKLKKFQQLLASSDLKLKQTNLTVNRNGLSNMDTFSTDIYTSIELIEFYLNNSNEDEISSNFYAECAEVKRLIQFIGDEYLPLAVKDIEKQIREISSSKDLGRKIFNDKVQSLSESLHRIDYFIEIYDAYRPFAIDLLNNFAISFLKLKETKEDTVEKIAEIIPTPETKKEIPEFIDRVKIFKDDAFIEPEFMFSTNERPNKVRKTKTVLNGNKKIKQKITFNPRPVRNVKFRDLVKDVLEAGYHLVRVNGSHHQYKNFSSSNTVTIPKHPIISRGVAGAVLDSIKKPDEDAHEDAPTKISQSSNKTEKIKKAKGSKGRKHNRKNKH